MICPKCGSNTHYGLDVTWYVRSMTLPSTEAKQNTVVVFVTIMRNINACNRH